MKSFSYTSLTGMATALPEANRPKPSSSIPITDFLAEAKKDNGKRRRARGDNRARNGGLGVKSSSINDIFHLTKAASANSATLKGDKITPTPKPKPTKTRSSFNDISRLLAPGAALVTDFRNSTFGKATRTTPNQENSPKKSSSSSNLRNILHIKPKKSPQCSRKKQLGGNDLDAVLQFVTKMKRSESGQDILKKYLHRQMEAKEEEEHVKGAHYYVGDDSSLWDLPCEEVVMSTLGTEPSGLFDDVSDSSFGSGANPVLEETLVEPFG